MNIVTASDIKKFLKLLNAGLKEGSRKEMKIWTSANNLDRLPIAESYYVSLEFRFHLSPEIVDQIVAEDQIDNDLLDSLLGKQP